MPPKLNPQHITRVTRRPKGIPTGNINQLTKPGLRLNPKVIQTDDVPPHPPDNIPSILTPPDQSSPQEAHTVKEPKRWQTLYAPVQAFYIAKLTPLCAVDKSTTRWIRNAADERAAQEGMKFSQRKGQFVVDWIEEYCRLYEDSAFVRAGSPLLCDDWQYEYFMQLFGWQRNSEELGGWIRRFTHAGIWIAKKNAKSPTLAATGLYMLIGDGEQGQKCYSVARDGKQAKIAHNHAIEMVKMSPILIGECKINHTDGIIRHIPTKSVFSVVHGENSRSTEGFNGSLFCDETHVLDQQHMDRLKRAGISRREPLHVEVSTAGNNADGYGLNRYEYGKRIYEMKSDRDYNPHFLFIDFSIDQKVQMDNLRDEKFVSNIAPICNPALGRILRKEEFMSDWRDAIQSDTELRQFAMYRLNLWLKDSATWVELADWLRCSKSPLADSLTEEAQETYEQSTEIVHENGRPVLRSTELPVYKQYTLEHLMEYPCVGGLDLSKTLDMTALTLIFAVPDELLGVRPYTWTWHWLPYVTADKYRRYIDLDRPEFRPWLQLVNQKTIDYEVIARRLEWIRDNFDLRSLGYDTYNSSDIVRYLINDYGWNEEMLVKVPQNMKFMGPITKEIERWIIRHEIHHPDNSLLSWQFQHVSLDTDRLGNYRIVKPDRDDYRKIDGIISLLIAGVTLCSDPTIWTPSHNSILLYDRKSSDQAGKASEISLTSSNMQDEYHPFES